MKLRVVQLQIMLYSSRYTTSGTLRRNRLLLNKKRKSGSPNVGFTGEEEGEGIEFMPITDNIQKYVGVQFRIIDEKFEEMPKYIFDGIVKGLKPPRYVFRIVDNGNCLFRAIVFILTESEEMHFTVRQGVRDYVEIYYQDLQPFCNFSNGESYIKESEMRRDAK